MEIKKNDNIQFDQPAMEISLREPENSNLNVIASLDTEIKSNSDKVSPYQLEDGNSFIGMLTSSIKSSKLLCINVIIYFNNHL